MKAKIVDLSALPFDRMDFRPLPPGFVDVQLRFYADQEAYDRMAEFFRSVEQSGIPDPTLSIPAPKPRKLRGKSPI